MTTTVEETTTCAYNEDGETFCPVEVGFVGALCDKHLRVGRDLADWIEGWFRNRTVEARAAWVQDHPHPVLGMHPYTTEEVWGAHAAKRGVTSGEIGDPVLHEAVEEALADGWLPHRSWEWTYYEESWLEASLGMVRSFTDWKPTPKDWRGEWAPEAANHDFVFLREEDVLEFVDGEPREWPSMSQAELAELIGVDRGSISRWEQGKREPTNDNYLRWLREKAAAVLGRSRRQVVGMVVKRDGWQHLYGAVLDAEAVYSQLEEVIFAPGGLYETWHETGTLPPVTPWELGVPEDILAAGAYGIIDPSL